MNTGYGEFLLLTQTHNAATFASSQRGDAAAPVMCSTWRWMIAFSDGTFLYTSLGGGHETWQGDRGFVNIFCFFLRVF